MNVFKHKSIYIQLSFLIKINSIKLNSCYRRTKHTKICLKTSGHLSQDKMWEINKNKPTKILETLQFQKTATKVKSFFYLILVSFLDYWYFMSHMTAGESPGYMLSSLLWSFPISLIPFCWGVQSLK